MRFFVLLLVLSIVLFFCDYRFHCFGGVRAKVSSVVVLVQYVINFPAELVHTFSKSFASKKAVQAENGHLNAELLLAHAKLQRLDYLERENAQLLSLLKHSKQNKNEMFAAQLLSSMVDKFGQQITIDKGALHGAYVGQPVIDVAGLLGQVIAVKTDVSRVLLITNRKSAIPVTVLRNGLQAIAVGLGDSEHLELVNISETADVKEGDSLVTSGLEKRFPAGYRVGVIKKVKRVIGERFMKILVAPTANVNGSNLHVLLIMK